jgi:hypothetical protein
VVPFGPPFERRQPSVVATLLGGYRTSGEPIPLGVADLKGDSPFRKELSPSGGTSLGGDSGALGPAMQYRQDFRGQSLLIPAYPSYSAPNVA